MASPHSTDSESADSARKPSFGESVTIRSVVLTGIFVLMIMYTLYLAAPLFIPLTVAFLLSLIFAPVIRQLRKIRIPPPVSATIILLALLAIVVGAVYGLAGPATKWIEKAPQELRTLDNELYDLFGPVVQDIKEAKETVKEVLPGGGKKSASNTTATTQWHPITWMVTGTWSFVYGLAISIIFLYFMLASGDGFLRKLVRVLERFEDKRAAVNTIQHIQHGIAVFWARSRLSISVSAHLPHWPCTQLVCLIPYYLASWSDC